MQIIRLEAENFKRLRLVEIEPDGTMVPIVGRNGQGKSSVLDAVWHALGGAAAAKGTSRPIRDGEDHAHVTVDLGDYIVTRTWGGSGTTSLKVESPDGARYRSPQQLLDGFIGRLSFDPLAFAEQPEREQLATLLGLVELPFDLAKLEAERRSTYEERTEVGRRAKQIEGQLAGMFPPADGLPDEEVSASELIARIQSATAVEARRDRLYAARSSCDAEIARLREQLAAAESNRAEVQGELDRLPEPVPVGPLQDQLATVEETNRLIRSAAEYTRLDAQLEALNQQYNGLTDNIVEIDTAKAGGVAAAAMPIDGLGFDDTGVTYQGIPLKQASSAEQLRVSMAMAMAMNPQIRVIRIKDGSLLDGSNLRLIEEMAAEQGFQCWVERVSDDGGVGFVIEDGRVVSS